MYFQCPYGNITTIVQSGLSSQSSRCNTDDDEIKVYSRCNNETAIINDFQDQCMGKGSCVFYYNPDFTLEDCSVDYEYFYIQAICQEEIIQLPAGFIITKTTIGIVISIMDSITILVFLAGIAVLRIYEELEYKEIDNSVLTIQNFAVRLTHLPDISNFGTLTEMKACLWNFLEGMIGKEP
mmetsp:Transcript_7230/g.6338  ORF Transcript_7230/g.6338 Transcript_7230/m.6338 type:complete len:181 (+) Transcript_7230:1225-1767(+)